MALEIKEHISLAFFTIYKIGGFARFFVEAKSAEEVEEALGFAAKKNIPFFILGAGSNILVSDKGFDGLVIRMNGGEVKSDGNRLIADAGVMMARAALEAQKAGLSGFEWGIGVPGTIGGSVRGNAGCFGSEINDVIESVKVFDFQKPTTYNLQPTDCEFSYRDSIFKRRPEWIILSATLRLQKGDPNEIREKMANLIKERTAKQDIGTKSCGCIFKNISWSRKDINRQELLPRFTELEKFGERPGIPASFLIDMAGLKGRRVGKISISSRHANFFINEGGGTAEEVIMLIAIAKDIVRRTFGLSLEEEIQYVGF
ncbi:MAG: UDP-N-acetylmuramate dehydrogenase [Parcubacteria group bacterium Gr01-1014_33]|nr:MAG: UDP-N-acetylmuramate dehydrogenase [Parcubacteria group bacterium Gr01-1014_33]